MREKKKPPLYAVSATAALEMITGKPCLYRGPSADNYAALDPRLEPYDLIIVSLEELEMLTGDQVSLPTSE